MFPLVPTLLLSPSCIEYAVTLLEAECPVALILTDPPDTSPLKVCPVVVHVLVT